MPRTRLLIAAFCALFIAVTAWEMTHLHRYLAPDSFTYFAMAQNVHETGLLYSYSGVDHSTGVHPGYYFLLIPFYPFAGLALPEWSFVLNGALLLAGLFLLYRAAGIGVAGVAGLLALTSQAAASANNGMESSLLFFALAGLAWIFLRSGESLSERDALIAGAFLGLAVFARLDAIFLAAALAACISVRASLPQPRVASALRAFRTLAFLLLPAALALALAFFLNARYDGTLLPLSGALKSSFPHLASAWPSSLPILKMFAASVALLLAYLGFRAFLRKPLGILVPSLLLSCVALFAYNLLFVSGIGAWYGALPFFALALTAGLFVRDIADLSPRLSPRFASVMVPLALVAIFVGHASRPVSDWITPNRDAAAYLSSIAQPGEAAAEYKDGIIAFYADIPVYSLTGLGNNAEYADAVRSGTLASYVESKGIAYVAGGLAGSGLQVPGAREKIACGTPFYGDDLGSAALFRIAACEIAPVEP